MLTMAMYIYTNYILITKYYICYIYKYINYVYIYFVTKYY